VIFFVIVPEGTIFKEPYGKKLKDAVYDALGEPLSDMMTIN